MSEIPIELGWTKVEQKLKNSGERIFEYIRIFEYFSPNIRYSNTNIVIFKNEYIRLFVILVTNIRIFEYSNIRYQNNEYCQAKF